MWNSSRLITSSIAPCTPLEYGIAQTFQLADLYAIVTRLHSRGNGGSSYFPVIGNSVNSQSLWSVSAKLHFFLDIIVHQTISWFNLGVFVHIVLALKENCVRSSSVLGNQPEVFWTQCLSWEITAGP